MCTGKESKILYHFCCDPLSILGIYYTLEAFLLSSYNILETAVDNWSKCRDSVGNEGVNYHQ